MTTAPLDEGEGKDDPRLTHRSSSGRLRGSPPCLPDPRELPGLDRQLVGDVLPRHEDGVLEVVVKKAAELAAPAPKTIPALTTKAEKKAKAA